MHCCRLSHPWVYKVGKMSSTLNVHGGGMQRWCSSNNIWMQDEYVYIFDIFWYQLFFLTTLSHHWICRHIFLVPSCQCYWNSGKTHLQKWEGKRMEGCQDAYLYFCSDCENASGTWHHAIWLWRINTNIKSLACVELSDLKYQGRRSFGLDIYLKKKIVPACFISGN